MATASARSFNNYSGIDRQRQLQNLPSAQERLGRPDQTQALRNVAPWALGLSERQATPSGRSWFDPARQAERWVRGTGSQDQTQAADAAQDFNEQADPIAAARKRAFGPPGRGVLNQGKIAGFDVVPSQVPQSVANPGDANGGAPQPMSFAPPANPFQAPPNVFTNPSTQNPAARASMQSIGNALGGGLTLPPPRRQPQFPFQPYS